jgi:hypothetical protein
VLAAAVLCAADLIFTAGRVWTVEAVPREARAVAVQGDRIVKVGTDAEALALRGPATEVIDLHGRLLLPGFIDGHTHFENAADWVFHVGLYDVSDVAGLTARLAAAVRRLPEGLWISGGDFGASAAWKAAAQGHDGPPSLVPDLKTIDAVTPRHPILIRRADGAYFANSEALRRARFGKSTPNPTGGRIEKDPATGAPTGMLFGRAGERVAELMPPPSLEQKLVGARLALEDLRAVGITSIHDVARLDELSQRKIFHTNVERSASNLDIFRELQRRGELTVRVYAFLTLPLWKEVVAAGVKPRTDDGLIRFGALKAFIDGFLMEEPYADSPSYAGDFTFRFTSPEQMERDIVGADASGFDPVVHTIGDKAHRLLLDWYEAAIRTNPARERRFRVIHAWYPSAPDILRMGRMKMIVDVTPNQLLGSLRTIDRSLGPERARTAHAWRSMMRAGARLDLVSDWPGSFNEQVPNPVGPLENISYAISRQSAAGEPAGGWHPEERLTVEEAIEAYTVNPAFASWEEDRKGTIREGKLADLVVVSRDILPLSPAEIRSTRVDYTVLGGKIIYRRPQ